MRPIFIIGVLLVSRRERLDGRVLGQLLRRDTTPILQLTDCVYALCGSSTLGPLWLRGRLSRAELPPLDLLEA
jgi:hypothetical protein